VPLVKIKRMLFSRLMNPSALQSVSLLPKRDAYLAGMLTNTSTQEEMSVMVGTEEESNEGSLVQAKPLQETLKPTSMPTMALRKDTVNAVPTQDSTPPIQAPPSATTNSR
jgi:hypothetical protein